MVLSGVKLSQHKSHLITVQLDGSTERREIRVFVHQLEINFPSQDFCLAVIQRNNEDLFLSPCAAFLHELHYEFIITQIDNTGRCLSGKSPNVRNGFVQFISLICRKCETHNSSLLEVNALKERYALVKALKMTFQTMFSLTVHDNYIKEGLISANQ